MASFQNESHSPAWAEFGLVNQIDTFHLTWTLTPSSQV